MPSSLNYHRELSLQLLFRKTSGKWKKRFVVLRRSLDISQKCYLDIYPHHRPVAKAIRKLGPGSSIEIAISPGSHAVIRDVSEDNKHNLLGLLSLSKSKEPYLFAAHCDGEVKDLDKLADAVEKLCEITSFEVSVDSDSNNSVPSGAAQFHIYKHTACLTSKSPFMKRVKDIEAFSNHRLLKSHSLEVLSDVSIQVTVNASTKGFDLLNDNQQNIELNDIENLRKGDWFIIEFHIQNSDNTNDQFIGNVSIGPTATMTCRRTCRADMGINEVFQRKVSTASILGVYRSGG
ncbi:hypothetical protein QZH41_017472 [Actinostola sp. cb2023]|nr:hypothetical protein QZH41_017472 [Actinostola sp. cb2023]